MSSLKRNFSLQVFSITQNDLADLLDIVRRKRILYQQQVSGYKNSEGDPYPSTEYYRAVGIMNTLEAFDLALTGRLELLNTL